MEGQGTPEGQFLVAGQIVTPAQPLTPGVKARWSLRPERVVLNPEGDGWEKLSGVVQSVSFLGSVVRTAVVLGDQLLWSDTLVDPRHPQPQVGTSVIIGFARDSGWIE